MNCFSVCSGIEAASVAWQPLGWKAVGFAEIDKFPSAVLAHHYPDVPNFGDFTKVTKADVGDFDLLVGGTPCQDFSIAGKGAGWEGARGSLTYEYVRLLSRTMPDWFVWENVPGAIQGDKRLGFTRFIRKLGELGYAVGWRVLDAQYVRVPGFEKAVPQRRRRIFLVGNSSAERVREVLFKPESRCWDTEEIRKERQGTAENISPSTTVYSREQFGGYEEVTTGAFRTLCARDYRDQGASGLVCVHGSQDPISNSETANCIGRNQGLEDVVAIAGNIIGRQAKNGGNHDGFSEDGVSYTLTTADRHAVCFQQNQRDEVRLIGGDGQIAGAIVAEAGVKQQNYIKEKTIVRRLTPVECERLMGFPDDYTCIPWNKKPAERCPDNPRYKALGNSMAVNCMRWLGMRIEEVIKNGSCKTEEEYECS